MPTLALKIVSAIIMFIISFIFAPICFRWIYQLYQNRKEMYMIKRNVKMTLTLNLSLTGYIIFIGLFAIASAFNNWSLINVIGAFLYLTLWIFLYCLLCKSWMIYYDYKWTYYTFSVKWETIINAKSHQKNWYIQHRKTYGNLSWIARILAIVFIICFIISNFASFTMFIGGPVIAIISILIIMICLLFPVISYIIILCKTPNSQKFNDLFFIHWESKLIAKLLLLFAILFILTLIINGFFSIIFPHFVFWSFIFTSLIFASYMVFIIYSSTKLIINKNTLSYLQKQQTELSELESFTVSGKPPTPTTNSQNKVIKILSNKDTVHLFMLHLGFEYSMEILLSFIEFCQYLTYLENEIPDEIASNPQKTKLDALILPDTLPSSTIVTNKDKDHNLKRKAYALYSKYIARGSVYEINISGKLRDEFCQLMDDCDGFMEAKVNMMEMYLLFKNGKSEMFQLLIYAHSRFRCRADYDKCKRLISASSVH